MINKEENIYFTANVIKLLTALNIDAAAAIAKNLKKLNIDIEETEDKIIYNAYVEKVGGAMEYAK